MVVGKKFLTMTLCLILLTVPFVIIEEPSEPEIPAYENGIWRDGPFPEGCYIPPETTPADIIVLEPPPPLMCGEYGILGYEEQRIQVAILLALEENFYFHHFFTPYGMLNGFHYASLQIYRASLYFEEVFNVELAIVGTYVWHQDSEQDIFALYEVHEESGFVHNGVWEETGKVVEVLVAWTLTLKVGSIDTHGIALLYHPFEDEWYWTCVIRYCAYWMDDNLAQHEVSHLLNATDGIYVEGTPYHSYCYYSDCVMSYRVREDVHTVYEDGILWTIPECEIPIGVTFLYNTWCTDSQEEINDGKWLYAQRDYMTPIIRGGC